MSESRKLYELAPILSPSIYETIFFSQYQSRLDKGALILDDETFRNCYISDNTYRVFLESNCETLKRAYFYIGVQQFYDSIITSIDFDGKDAILNISYKAIKELANEVIKENRYNIKTDDFIVKLIFRNIIHYSRNTLDSKELLKKINTEVKNSVYLQDQITFMDDKSLQIVISMKNADSIEYLVFESESIEVDEVAKDLWTSMFPENLHMLYDYFLNFRTKNSNCFDTSNKKILNEYEKFIELLDE